VKSYRFLTFSVAFLPFVYGCTQWGPEKDEVLARVGTDYLYRDDLIAEFNFFENESDSILKSRAFIDSWAREKILIDKPKSIYPPLKSRSWNNS
jgi:hypothetical protein